MAGECVDQLEILIARRKILRGRKACIREYARCLELSVNDSPRACAISKADRVGCADGIVIRSKCYADSGQGCRDANADHGIHYRNVPAEHRKPDWPRGQSQSQASDNQANLFEGF